jgi:hypothetical protein
MFILKSLRQNSVFATACNQTGNKIHKVWIASKPFTQGSARFTNKNIAVMGLGNYNNQAYSRSITARKLIFNGLLQESGHG